MKSPFKLVILLSILFGFKSQCQVVDSLQNLLKSEISDSLRGYVLDELSFEWFYDDLDSSLHYALLSYDVFESIDYKKGMATAIRSIAVAYHYKNDWDSAEYFYQKSAEFNNSIGDSLGQAGSLNNLGVLYMDKGLYEKAAANFLASLRIKDKLQDTLGIASGNSNLGIIFRKQGNPSKAIEHYLIALEIYEKKNRPRRRQTVYLNLGALFNETGEFEKGKTYNLKSLEQSSGPQSRRSYAESCVNLSDSYLGLKRIDSSLYYSHKAIATFEEISDSVNLAHALNSAGNVYLEDQNFNQALSFANKSLRINQKLQNLQIQVSALEVRSSALAKLGRIRQAYTDLTSLIQLNDSLLNGSLNESINRLAAQYETEKKDKQIVLFELEQERAALSLVKSNNQRNIFIAATILIFISSILFYFMFQQKKKSLRERETLLKEIHHRVKNNLQIVSSLLNLQAGSLDDEAAIDAVKEGQNRVKSMALIHENLYQNDNLSGIAIDDYIRNLMQTLYNSFGIDEERIVTNLKVENLKLDIDTIIPLGLIINELLSNSLKYAFPDGKGHINVGLQQSENSLNLSIHDSGSGFNEDKLENSNSYGWKMVKSLSRKLKADISVNTTEGTEIFLKIKNYQLVA